MNGAWSRFAKERSESWLVMGLLAVVGGYLDAYTYLSRGHVFANAQTGNIVFLGFSIVELDYLAMLHYAIMIAAFVLGVIVSDLVRHLGKESWPLHWQQIVVLLEACLLFGVAFFPGGSVSNIAVNATISAVCAMQVECFRKVHGINAATTMCTGNLRSGTEQLYLFLRTRDKTACRNSGIYFGMLLLFVVGVAFGTAMTRWLDTYASLIGCGILLLVFSLLFVGRRSKAL